MPQLMIAFTELDFIRFSIFDGVINFGVETDIIPTRRIRPMIVPILLLKKLAALPEDFAALDFSICIPPECHSLSPVSRFVAKAIIVSCVKSVSLSSPVIRPSHIT